MEQADRETIKRKNVILSKEMDFVGVTSGLIARRIFENHHIESFSSERSKREKNMALLMEIETRGPKAFASLVESLIEANQEHLAQELRYPSSGPSQGRKGKEYKMKSQPRGIAVIINNKNFNAMLKLGHILEDRQGTDVDRDKLQNMFVQLQFQVSVHNDCTGIEIKKIIEQMRNYNHSSYDCFILAILSHGKEGDAIYGTDGDHWTLEYIMDQFGADLCPTLSGKPKLFFVQACRGGKYDYGVQVNAVDGTDSSAPTRKMPCQSDMFLAYSTVPGYVSWRSAEGGSWFIQALTEVIHLLAKSKDLGTMMTRVNYKLSRDFESVSEEKYKQGCKQISAPVNMLTKDLYFFSKQERENLT